MSDKTIYQFTAKDSDGKEVSLEKYKGDVVLIVNVASKCGLTNSNYTQLKEVLEKFQDKGLRIAAFPCNQFGGQINLFISITFIGIASAIIGFVINSITITSLLIKRAKGLLIHVNHEKPEIKLFIIALIMFVHEFILGIIFAGLYITANYYPGSTSYIILLAIEPFVANLAALSPSWMLFISSRRIREALFGKYFARSNQVAPVQVISSSR